MCRTTVPSWREASSDPAIKDRFLQIAELVDDLESSFFSHDTKEVCTEEIGEMVMERLKTLDQVAYVRFASVYREFQDINTFVDEIGKLLKTRGKGEE